MGPNKKRALRKNLTERRFYGASMNGGSLNSAAPKVISIPSQPVLIGFQEEFCQMREPPTLAREPAPSCRIPVIVACRRPACRKENFCSGDCRIRRREKPISRR